MKYQYGFVFLMIAMVVIIDLFLFWRWKKSGWAESNTGKLLALFLFAIMPAFFIGGFLYVGNVILDATSSLIYRNFGWLLYSFLLVYTSKLIFSKFHGLGLILSKIPSKQKEKVRHYPRLSRRKFLSQVGIIMATAPFVSLLFGAFRGRHAFYTRHVRLSFPNLPAGFDGLRIVQISDLHIGSFGGNRQPIIEAFDIINREQPDMILFTGDLVNNFAGELNGWEPIFARLKAPMGKYSILGNHDYGNYSRWSSKADKMANFDGIVKGYAKLGFKLLRNESVVVSRDGQTIGLAGVENWGTASYPQNGDVDKAAIGIDGQPFKLLMTHDPDHWDQQVLPQNKFDVTLAGHTHGMQFGIERGNFRWSPAQYVQKRWAGLYREGNKFLYVNRGLGYHGLPARVGMPPEITVFKLSRGSLAAESV